MQLLFAVFSGSCKSLSSKAPRNMMFMMYLATLLFSQAEQKRTPLKYKFSITTVVPYVKSGAKKVFNIGNIAFTIIITEMIITRSGLYFCKRFCLSVLP